MRLSFIVSAYDRPDDLLVCLLSLRRQKRIVPTPWRSRPVIEPLEDVEVIVCDNSADMRNAAVTKQAEADYVHTHASDCYASAMRGVTWADGEFLCFPSDDNYYVPEFAARMLRAADGTGAHGPADFVYCDMLYDPRYYGRWKGRYEVVDCMVKRDHVDKGGFIIRRTLFNDIGGFAANTPGEQCAADGALVEAVVKSGARVAKVEELLWFHG